MRLLYRVRFEWRNLAWALGFCVPMRAEENLTWKRRWTKGKNSWLNNWAPHCTTQIISQGLEEHHLGEPLLGDVGISRMFEQGISQLVASLIRSYYLAQVWVFCHMSRQPNKIRELPFYSTIDFAIHLNDWKHATFCTGKVISQFFYQITESTSRSCEFRTLSDSP